MNTSAGLRQPTQLVATRGQLLPALTALASVRGKLVWIGTPALAGVVLDPGTQTMWCSNYAHWLSVAAPITGERPALVDLAVLLAAVKAGPRTKAGLSQVVIVTVTDDAATITCAGAVIPLPTLALPDYPAWVQTPSQVVHTTTGPELNTAWAAVAWASSAGPNALPVLASVHAAAGELGATLQATDRYRAARHPLPGVTAGTFDVLLADTLGPALSLLNGSVTVAVADPGRTTASVTFTDGCTTLRTLTMAGEFPNLAAMWAATPARSCTFERDTMMAAVRQVLPGAQPSAPVTVSDAGVTFTVTGCTNTAAAISSPVPYDGDPDLTFSVKPQHLLSMLKAFPVGPVRVSFAAGRSPLRFASASSGLDVLQMPALLG